MKDTLIIPSTKINPKVPTMFFLKNYITKSKISVGDYTYYHDFNGEQAAIDFENKNILYHFPDMMDDQLIIGKFCSIAQGTLFIMNGGNHNYQAISTFPFFWLKEDTDSIKIDKVVAENQFLIKSPTIIGNDVWIGHDATILRGVTIGNGAIIAAKTVVTSNVPPYAIVGGNPSKIIKYRFDQEIVQILEASQWWNWPIEKIKEKIDFFEKIANSENLKQFLSEN